MSKIRETLEKNGGIYRLKPIFVPRRFSRPGLRLRLHPDDLYALGTKMCIRDRLNTRLIKSRSSSLSSGWARPKAASQGFI